MMTSLLLVDVQGFEALAKGQVNACALVSELSHTTHGLARQIAVMRAYCSPRVSTFRRSAFRDAGFEIVETSGADETLILMTLDLATLSDGDTPYEEAVLLGGSADYTALARLARRRMMMVSVANHGTLPTSLEALADGLIDLGDLEFEAATGAMASAASGSAGVARTTGGAADAQARPVTPRLKPSDMPLSSTPSPSMPSSSLSGLGTAAAGLATNGASKDEKASPVPAASSQPVLSPTAMPPAKGLPSLSTAETNSTSEAASSAAPSLSIVTATQTAPDAKTAEPTNAGPSKDADNATGKTAAEGIVETAAMGSDTADDEGHDENGVDDATSVDADDNGLLGKELENAIAASIGQDLTGDLAITEPKSETRSAKAETSQAQAQAQPPAAPAAMNGSPAVDADGANLDALFADLTVTDLSVPDDTATPAKDTNADADAGAGKDPKAAPATKGANKGADKEADVDELLTRLMSDDLSVDLSADAGSAKPALNVVPER